MYKYRISKYNPKFRSFTGKYINDEWTSISDIGKIYNNKEFTKKEYIITENKYISAIMLILYKMNIVEMQINNLYVWKSVEDILHTIKKFHYGELYTNSIIKFYKNITQNIIIDRADYTHLTNKYLKSIKKNIITLNIDNSIKFCRLLLREDIGGDLIVLKRLKIFIGYDYLMCVHTSILLDDIIDKIENLGLFVEVL